MAKTQPTGVRFNKDLLESLFESGIARSAQKALNLYEKAYLESVAAKVKENNKPENKAKIEAGRNGDKTNFQYPQELTGSFTDDLQETIQVSFLSAEVSAQIANIEKELKNPPKNPAVGLKVWIKVRQDKIKQLQKQL